jgi:hypothetical protein
LVDEVAIKVSEMREIALDNGLFGTRYNWLRAN